MNYNMLLLSVTSVFFLYILTELDDDIRDMKKSNTITKNKLFIHKLNVVSIFAIIILISYILL
jgi:hypothetical protein